MTEQDFPGQRVEDLPRSIDEIKGRYGSRWILGQVIEYDDRNSPSHIKVLTASRSRAKISKDLAKLRSYPTEEAPQGSYCIFHTNPMSGLRFRLARGLIKTVLDL